MIPGVSAGSNQVGASETWIPQVSRPSGSAAKAKPGAATRPNAARARASRRVMPRPLSFLSRRLANESMILLRSAGPYVRALRLWYGTLQQLSGSLQGDVLVRRGVREPRNQAEPRFPDPRAHTVEKGELPDR